MPLDNPTNFKVGINKYFTSKLISTSTKTQNKTVRANGFSHKKYSTNKVKIKYNKPKVKKRILPFINSLV
jgi:hypothetical protein